MTLSLNRLWNTERETNLAQNADLPLFSVLAARKQNPKLHVLFLMKLVYAKKSKYKGMI